MTGMYGFLMREIALMMLLSDNKSDFTQLIRTMGLYFQIRNDYMSLCLQQVTPRLLLLDGEVVHACKCGAIKVQMALI
jgi:hypothetical protein